MSSENTRTATADFGVLGLGVMGQNLALNIERNGFRVAVANREPEKAQAFVHEKGQGKKLVAAASRADFARSLERPRRLLLMVKAGDPVDWTVAQLKPYLEEGDILIDGGNSHFEDTRRRERALTADVLRFVGS